LKISGDFNLDFLKIYSNRSLVLIAIFMIFLFILIDSTFYIMLSMMQTKLSSFQSAENVMHAISDTVDEITVIQIRFKKIFIPISAGLFGFLGFLIWFSLRFSFKNLLNKSGYSFLAKERQD